MKKLAVALATIALPTTLLAADKDPVYGWSGTAGVGAVIATGNSETQNINLDAKIKNENELWRHNFFAAALKSENASVTTADRFALGYKGDYKLTPRSYLWGEIRYEEDAFSGFDNQISGSTGYGHKVLDTATDKLDAEIGIAQRETEFSTGLKESDTGLRGAIFYTRKLSESAAFTQDLLVFAGDSNTSIDSKSAIKAKLAGNFSLEASHTIKHNTDAPVGKEDTDSTTALSIIYGF